MHGQHANFPFFTALRLGSCHVDARASPRKASEEALIGEGLAGRCLSLQRRASVLGGLLKVKIQMSAQTHP